jgi:hypothetical protein
MKKTIAFTLLFCAVWTLAASAQNTVESIRKEYQDVQKWIAEMRAEGLETNPEYYDLHVMQYLPATGRHEENICMYYTEKEPDSEDEEFTLPPRLLRFATAKYNFAARKFYEEYLYDDKGQVMFIFAITVDVDEHPYQLRMWFDGNRLLQFTAKQIVDEQIDDLLKANAKMVYSGTTIPEKYQMETDRYQQQAEKHSKMFKSIDENTYK